VQKGDTYTTVGTLSAASVDTLTASGAAYPAGLAQRYTQLPSDLPVEVRQLAVQIAGDAQQPYEIARRVEQYLRANYAFDLNVPDPPPLRDAVDYFLFDSRAGYFDYDASAMAVLLRTLGIPTRVVTGFALDKSDLNATTKAYDVSELRAWAWPEVYFAGLGWVEFNPTPTRAAVTRPLDDTAALQARDNQSALAFPDTFDQALLDQLEVENGASIRRFTAPTNSVGSQIGSVVVRVAEIVFAAAAVVVVLTLAGRVAWEWAFRGLSPPMRRWAKVQRLGAWARIDVPSTATPLEATRLLGGVVDEPRALERLARSYTAARYSGHAREETEDQARELNDDYRRVQRRLARVVARRLVPIRRRGDARATGSALRGTPAARR
jgi:hypothetical protein